MEYDISKIGQINCTLNFDEDDYDVWLSENNLKDTPFVKEDYVKEHCDYTIEYFDSEYYHHMDGFDSMTYDEIEENFGYALASDVLKKCMDGEEQSFEILAYENDDVDLNNPDEVNAAAIRVLQHGAYFKGCRGFILTNGVVVYTESEHNACTRITGVNGTSHFIRLGNIRILRDSVDIAKYPTKEQFQTLNVIFDAYYGETLYLDLKGGMGTTSIKYTQCDGAVVKRDIDDYFHGRVKERYIVRESLELVERQMPNLIEWDKKELESDDPLVRFNENLKKYFPLYESVRNGLLLEKMGISANAEAIYTKLKEFLDDNVRDIYRDAETDGNFVGIGGYQCATKKISGFNIFGDTKISIQLYVVGCDSDNIVRTISDFRTKNVLTGFNGHTKSLSLLVVFNKDNSEWYDPADKLAHESRHIYNFIMANERPQYIKVSRENYNHGVEAVNTYMQYQDVKDIRFYSKYIGMAFYFMNRDELRAYSQELYQKLKDISFIPAENVVIDDDTYRRLSTIKNVLNSLTDDMLSRLLVSYNPRKSSEMVKETDTEHDKVIKDSSYHSRMLLYAKKFRKSVELMLNDYTRAIGRAITLARGEDAI